MSFTSLVLAVWASGFLAATLLPGGSEAAFVLALSQLDEIPDLSYTPWLASWPNVPANSDLGIWLLVHISIANTLGALVTFFMGYVGARWLPEEGKSRSLSVSLRLFKRYGLWSLLLSWLPLVGDVLCLAAGVARLPWLWATVLIFVGKFVRYSLIWAAVVGVVG